MPTSRRSTGSISDSAEYAALRALLAEGWGLEELQRHGAHGVGIGRKIKGGRRTRALALRVYVESKGSLRRGTQMVPPKLRARHPVTGDEVALLTDVVQCPPARYHAIDPMEALRPVPGGVSCGPKVVAGREGATGTLGGWAWDPSHGSVVLLSNDHVLGHVPGIDIFQPGTADVIGHPPGRIGAVRRGIDRGAHHVVTCDCAIGALDEEVQAAFMVPDIGPAILGIADPALDMSVEKFGRTTSHTFGTVDDLHWRGLVQSDAIGQKPHLYDDCVRIVARKAGRPWGAAGDSGSLVFSVEPLTDGSGIRPVVGLHFGGEASFGYACRITRVFDMLKITTLTDGIVAELCAPGNGASARPRADVEVSIQTGAERTRKRRVAAAERATAHPRPSDTATVVKGVQALLTGSPRGRRLGAALSRHRAELVQLLLPDVTLRQEGAAALRPILAGHRLTGANVSALTRFMERLGSKGSPVLRRALTAMSHGVVAQLPGSTLGAALGGVPSRPARGSERSAR